MGNRSDMPTSSASSRQWKDHDSTVKAPSGVKMKVLVRLCFALLLAAMIAIGTSSYLAAYQTSSITSTEHQSDARPRQSIVLTKREATNQNEEPKGKVFDFARFDLLSNSNRTSPAMLIVARAVRTMYSWTRAPKNISFVNVVGQLLFESLGADKDYEIRNQYIDTQLTRDAKKVILDIPLPAGSDRVLGGSFLQIAALRTEDTVVSDAAVALCSPRGKVSTFLDIRYLNEYVQDECFFSLKLSGAGFENAKISVIAYPKNWIIRPLPFVGENILNSRVVDVATDRTSSEDQLVSIFFKPSLQYNTTIGCSMWNEAQGNWTANGCRVNASTSTCHCNMSREFQDEATGAQFLVYEYSEVWFTEQSYNYLDSHVVYQNVAGEVFFSVASALMHNLTLIPIKKIVTKYFLNQILAFTLDGIYGSEKSVKTNSTLEYIKRIYADARTIVRRPIEGEGLSITHRNLDMVTITSAIAKPSDFKTSFYFDHFLKAKFAPSTAAFLQAIPHIDFTIALSASDSVAEQNELVAYMVFPVNRFLFAPVKDYGLYQVHNFRIVDVTLSPRAASRAEEAQFIDVWYRPSITLAKDVRLGCAYWNTQDSAWTSQGCEVLENANPPRCRFNLTAHFDDNREGGQYVVLEYSDIFLESERLEKILDNEQPDPNNKHIITEMVSYLQNLTKIGYIDEYYLFFAHRIANYAFTNAEELVRDDVNVSSALTAGMRVIARTWSGDSNRFTSMRGRVDEGTVSSASRVALEAHEVLSNEAVLAKSFLRRTSFFFLRFAPTQDTYRGVSIFHKKLALWNESETYFHDSPEFSLHFSVSPGDHFLLTAIIFPASKMLLPLSDTLPPIFSYHGVDLGVIEDPHPSRATNRLVTLIYVPESPKRAAALTACAAWTGNDWSTTTCWPVTGIEHACTCNVSAHAMPIGRFQHFLIYEAISAPNFSPITSLDGLDILYVISSTASLIGLALIILTAVIFPTWRADVGHKIMVHLSVALFLYQTLRLVRETHHVYTALNRDLTTTFVVFTAVTHYSRLAHYAWMLIMSVLQLRRLLTVVGASDIPHLLVKVSVLAWGVPLIPLVALLSWNVKGHFARPDAVTHLVLYLVPGAAVLIINIILLVIIGARVFACFGWGVVDDLGRHGISDAKLTGRRMAMLLLLFFLFGTPTLFEMVNDFWGHSVMLEVLFKVFDPARGVVVFVFFVILDRSTFDLWRQKVKSLAAISAAQSLEMK